MKKRQALVIGINEYPSGNNLSTAAQDAERIAQLLEQHGGFEVYRLPIYKGEREVSQDLFVTLPELKTAITQLFQPKSGIIPETALLFFAGHGWRREKDGQTEGFLVTSCNDDNCSESGLFSLKDLHKILKDSPVRQQIVWLDCCHSGELFNFLEQDLAEFEQQRKIDRCFIAASREFQIAYGGVLTPALLEALDPTNKDEDRVTNLTLKPLLEAALQNAPQHSVIRNTGSQIILTHKGGVRGNICPYKGLDYFDFNPTKHQEAEDHRYFYGRTQLTNQLLGKVASGNFLAVIGASGSGKSSVVRAGLLYQLYLGNQLPLENKLPGSDRWTFYPPFTPGINPIKSLEQVVGKLTAPDDLVHFIERLPTERVVLVIDQFEEIFTQCRDEKERQKFFAYLMGAVERLGNKLCLVLVMRDDFRHKCAEQDYAGLANKIDNNLVIVQRMNRQELQEVILEPAERVELEIDGDLVEQMIADVSDSPGDLALLQYTLTQLWENSSLNLLTISDYSRLGGVQKALGNHADTVYSSLSPEEKKAARWIFLELTRLSEDEKTPNTRQQVWQKDLVNSQQSEELINNVVNCLADAKLVVTSEQELEGQRVAVVNVVHETLIRNWELLGGWLDKNRDALLRKQNIEDAAKKWRDRGQVDGYLQGKLLTEASNYQKKQSGNLTLSNLAVDFIQKSRKYRNRQIGLSFVAPIFIIVFFGFLGYRFYEVRQLWATVEAAQKQKNSLARNQALEKLVKAGESLANRDFVEYDLTGINLQNADLSGANLQGAILKNADLKNTKLRGSFLGKANLSGANLNYASLSDTNFTDAYLNDVKLNGANLNNADLSGADLSNAKLQSADLSNAKLQGADLRRADLQNSNLTKANLNDADLGFVNLQKASLVEADLRDAYLGDTNLTNANLSNANLSNVKNLTYKQIQSADNWQKSTNKALITNSKNQYWIPVEVTANKEEWTKTNICLKKGLTLNILAKGKWSNGIYERSDGTSFQPFFGADGFSTPDRQKTRNTWLIPTAKIGSLVGRINNKLFIVGAKKDIKAVEQDGCLELAMNENNDYKTNIGELSIIIRTSP